MMSFIFSIGAETVGLYGDPFAVGWTLSDKKGKELECGFMSCPSNEASGTSENRRWINENVVPHLPNEYTHTNPDGLCDGVWRVWERIKREYKGVQCIADCGYPVQSGLFRRAIQLKLKEREFNGPFPLHEVATARELAGIAEEEFPRLESELPEHVPVHDARYSARLYRIAFEKIAKLNSHVHL